MAAAHSYWSASNFESIMLCPGKIVLEDGAPDNANHYAAEGTAAHQVLTWALEQNLDAAAYIGRLIHLDARGKVCDTPDTYVFEVDAEMAEHVQVCIDYVREVAGDTGVILVDQRVNYSDYLGVDPATAWGTLDVIVFRDEEIIGIDLKYGRGVEVSAERNPQVSLYVLGALQAYQGVVGEFTRVRLAISQPRVRRAASEWDCSVEELEQWALSAARDAVVQCINAKREHGSVFWSATYLRPAEKACKFCKAKATCPALRDEVADTLGINAATPEEFAASDIECMPQDQDAEWLAVFLGKVDLIEDWCKAVRAEAERRLLAGAEVPGFKLVAGRKGARQWADAKAVEQTMKSMRLKIEEMYDLKLISPTTAEKLAKAGAIGPKQWPKLKDLITQKDSAPSVAPATDSRPALVIAPVVDDFDAITEQTIA